MDGIAENGKKKQQQTATKLPIPMKPSIYLSLFNSVAVSAHTKTIISHERKKEMP